MSKAGRRTLSSSNELPVSRLQWSSLVIIMAVVKSSRRESVLSGVELQFCSLGATDSWRVYLSCITPFGGENPADEVDNTHRNRKTEHHSYKTV